MVVDTSAILAILLREPDAARFARAVAEASHRQVSAAGVVETGIVLLARTGSDAELDEWIAAVGATVSPVTAEQSVLARVAYREYGKGRHPAALNYGDRFAYALAKASGEPLLFTGNDFGQTDIVVYPLPASP